MHSVECTEASSSPHLACHLRSTTAMCTVEKAALDEWPWTASGAETDLQWASSLRQWGPALVPTTMLMHGVVLPLYMPRQGT